MSNLITHTGYHGSSQRLSDFNTKEIFLAKDPTEARRYGEYVHVVDFTNAPIFETPTIYVIKESQVLNIELLST